MGAYGDKDRVELRKQGFYIVDAVVELQINSLGQDGIDLALDDLWRQAIRRDANAHHTAWHRQRLEDGHRAALPHQVLGAGQASRAGTDDRHALTRHRLWAGFDGFI